MAHNDRTVFMEDYTLDLRSHEAILGAHMLEVDPSIASDQPRVGGPSARHRRQG